MAVGLSIWSIAANAQTQTLDYQSAALAGVTPYYNNATSGYLLTPQQFAACFASAPFTGNVTVSLNLSNGDFIAGAIDVTGNNGKSINFGFDVSASNLGVASQPFTTFNGSAGTIDLTKTNGAITGAAMDIAFSSYHGSYLDLRIGPSGDSISYTYAGTNGPCTAQQSGGGPNPCTIGASSSSAGVWKVTAAPEIDPASAASGLTLLLGFGAVLRGRRRPTYLANS